MAFSILPLPTLFDRFLAGDEERLSRGNFVVITMDDGSNCDFLDSGAFRSMNSMLRDFVLRRGSTVGDRHLATSFVVASPDARRPGVRDDFWWRECVKEFLIAIESHSWDHCQPNVHPVAQKDQIKGTFRYVETYEDADVQFRKSREYIESVTHSACRYFAYPWGERNAYLTDQYLPLFQNEHRYIGCVTT
ncbi:MAG TPA: polysaccharide deacetylase family protein, partial [Roseiarcus sp.]|nr:polysaccharide deacetylase family protein [Roseiarcus sp.]